uniref:Uncharacterized protein n=1 Tax=viral metagenome TaxID=1070528 RepID=A0A6C0H9I8_9ZZZZ
MLGLLFIISLLKILIYYKIIICLRKQALFILFYYNYDGAL